MLVAEAVFDARQAARHLVWRRVGEGQAGDLVEVGEVAARSGQLRMEAAEVERLVDGTVRAHARRSRVQARGEHIGPVAPHIDQRSAGDRQDDRFAVQVAVAGQREAPATRSGRILLGLHVTDQMKAATHVGDDDVAVAHDQMFDGRQLQRFLVVAALGAPVRVALGVGVEFQVGVLDVDQRQVEASAQQRRQAHADGETVDVGVLLIARPGRIGDADVAGGQRRRPGENVRLKVPADHHFAMGLCRGPATDRPLEPIPVPECDQEHDRQQQEGEDPAAPDAADDAVAAAAPGSVRASGSTGLNGGGGTVPRPVSRARANLSRLRPRAASRWARWLTSDQVGRLLKERPPRPS